MRRFDGYAFDLDGTVYLGDALLPGAKETIEALRADGARIVFVTNKPLETSAEYAAKLTRLGVPAGAEDIVTAIDSLLAYLGEHHREERLLVVAESAVEAALREAGWELVADPAAADLVVVSFDRGFDYAKLDAAYRAVRHGGAAIVATNPDPFCPTPDGGLPDCAAMLAAIEACSGGVAEAVLGKPSETMARALLERLGTEPAATVMVGDRLDTDVAMGQRAGMTGVLVLSGSTEPGAVADSSIEPDLVLEGIGGLLSGAHPDREDR